MLYCIGILVLLFYSIEEQSLSKVSPDLRRCSDWTLTHPHHPLSIITCAHNCMFHPSAFRNTGGRTVQENGRFSPNPRAWTSSPKESIVS